MAESKIFRLVEGVDSENIGRAVEGFLRDRKGMTAEGAKTPEGYFVQAKGNDGGWKTVAGMNMATQIQIIQSGDMVTVNIGQGKWSDKVGAAAVGMVLFAPLAVTAAIGAWNQKKLPQEIFAFVEQFIMSGGRSVTVSMGASMALKEGQVLCPNCKTPNPQGTKFCESCGAKLMEECPSCHAGVPIGKKFCPLCGSPMKLRRTCPVCRAEVPDGTKFCPECGSSMTVEVECPGCHAKISGDNKFCPECGASLSGKRECPHCHREVADGTKFCPECGLPL